MNSWLIFALLGPFFWGITNVLDSVMRRHFIQDDFVMTWQVSLVRIPFAIFFFYLGGIEFPDPLTSFLMVLAGLLWSSPLLLYFKAMHFEEPTRVALLLQSTPLWTLLIAFALIGETLELPQMAAFALLILGGLLAGARYLKGKWHFSKAIPLMLIATFLWALSDVSFKKFEPHFSSFNAAFGLYVFGSALFILAPLFIRQKIPILSHFAKLPLRGWIILTTTATAGVLGSLSVAYALTLGKASLTTALMGIQPLFVFIIGLFCAPFIPEFYKEAKDRTSLSLKGTALIFVMAGLFLLQ